jgi:8-oxo-dGTP pyrophosphatase MutT (NUDIX family)
VGAHRFADASGYRGDLGVIHLATGLLVRDGRLLMVASRYANHDEPLWNLPGGRQLPGELLSETVAREVLEETGLCVEPLEVAYVSESYDGDVHYLNVTFVVSLAAQPFDSARFASYAHDDESDHTTEVAWVPLAEAGDRIVVAVVREPLTAYLGGALRSRYAGYHQAGVTIEWPEGSR